MQTLVAQVVFFYLLRQEGDVEHIRCFGYVFGCAVIVKDINAVICRVIHILLDAGGGDEITRLGERNVQLPTDLQNQFFFPFLALRVR